MKVQRIEPAYQQVARQLRDTILHGELTAGTRLPNEAELSGMFGVGRGTIREALRVLSSQNLVTIQRGVKGGNFVAHPKSTDVAEYLETSLGLLSGAREVSVDELVEARALLEVPAARLAAQRISPEHLASLWVAVEEEEQALSAGFEGHVAMHSVVLKAAGNGLVEIMTEPIFSVLRTRFLRDRAPRRFWKQVAHDHRGIVERIAAGDGDGAAAAMESHLNDLRDLYQRIDGLARVDERTADEPPDDELGDGTESS